MIGYYYCLITGTKSTDINVEKHNIAYKTTIITINKKYDKKLNIIYFATSKHQVLQLVRNNLTEQNSRN